MSHLLKKIIITLIAFSIYPLNAQEVSLYEQALEFRRASIAAFREGDFELAAKENLKALEIIPGHPGLHTNQATFYQRQGDFDNALLFLDKYVAMGLRVNLNNFEFPENLKTGARFIALENNLSKIKSSNLAQEIFAANISGYLIEGLAYDEKRDVYYLTSINKREILEVTANGNISVLANSEDGLLGAMDIKIGPDGDTLWVTSSGLDQAEGLKDKEKGRSSLHRFDLNSKTMVKTFKVEGQHNFGSITFSPKGELYLSDTTTNSLFVLDKKAQSLEQVMNISAINSMQGIAFNNDGSKLFVADYSSGFFVVDLVNKEYKHLATPEGATLLAVDGLYYKDGELIAIQNGVNPFRIIKASLSENEDSIESVVTLDGAHPDFIEPTNGHLFGDTLIFTGNSGWQAYGNSDLSQEEREKLLGNPKVFSLKVN